MTCASKIVASTILLLRPCSAFSFMEMPSNSTLERMPGTYYPVEYGVFFECPSGEYVNGLCGSGSGKDCKAKKNTHNGVSCVRGLPKVAGTQEVNGWVCGASGETMECPPDEVLVGRCGAGKYADCKINCDSPSHQAIKCAKLVANYEVSGEPTWKPPFKKGQTDYCAEDSLACGACGSNQKAECGGEHNRMRCCKTVDCSNSENERKAYWEFITSLPSEASTWQLTLSTTREDTYSSTFTQAYTNTLSTQSMLGFSFMGSALSSASVSVGYEFSATTSNSITETVSQVNSASTTFIVQCPADAPNVWQYRYEHDGGCPSKLKTVNYACVPVVDERGQPAKPCCLPGYGLPGTGYQECVVGSPNICE